MSRHSSRFLLQAFSLCARVPKLILLSMNSNRLSEEKTIGQEMQALGTLQWDSSMSKIAVAHRHWLRGLRYSQCSRAYISQVLTWQAVKVAFLVYKWTAYMRSTSERVTPPSSHSAQAGSFALNSAPVLSSSSES